MNTREHMGYTPPAQYWMNETTGEVATRDDWGYGGGSSLIEHDPVGEGELTEVRPATVEEAEAWGVGCLLLWRCLTMSSLLVPILYTFCKPSTIETEACN